MRHLVKFVLVAVGVLSACGGGGEPIDTIDGSLDDSTTHITKTPHSVSLGVDGGADATAGKAISNRSQGVGPSAAADAAAPGHSGAFGMTLPPKVPRMIDTSQLDLNITVPIPRGGRTVASIRTLPFALCTLTPFDETKKGAEIVADSDGIVRLHLANNNTTGKPSTVELECVDTDDLSRAVSHKLTVVPDDFAVSEAPAPLNRTGKRTLPVLIGDPMSYDQRDLFSRGYPRRPDPTAMPTQFARWQKLVTSAPTIVEPHPVQVSRKSSNPTTNNWSGAYINRAGTPPTYGFVSGVMYVPELLATPIDEDFFTYADSSFWVGLGGYLPNSNLLQCGTEQWQQTAGPDGDTYAQGYDAWSEWIAQAVPNQPPLQDPSMNVNQLPVNPNDEVYLAEWLGNPDDFGSSPNGGMFQTAEGWVSGITAAQFDAGNTLLGDVNGDGLADVIAIEYGGIWVAISTGAGFRQPVEWWSGLTSASANFYIGDVNGDGFADVVQVNGGTVNVALSTGASFGSLLSWATIYSGYFSVPRLGDFNGDGKLDLITVSAAYGLQVFLSTGTAFQGGQWSGYGLPNTSGVLLTGDVNGDGITDAILYDGNYTSVATSLGAIVNGEGFTSWATWLPTNFDLAVGGITYATMADANGDGLADLIGQYNVTTYVALSTGSGFAAPAVWQNQLTSPSGLADVNGDGLADEVFCYGTYINVSPGVAARTDWSPGTTAWYYQYNITQNVMTEYGENETVFGLPPFNSAEWIMERPSQSNGTVDYFANYQVAISTENYALDYKNGYHDETTDPLTVYNCDDTSNCPNGVCQLLSVANVTNNSVSFVWQALN